MDEGDSTVLGGAVVGGGTDVWLVFGVVVVAEVTGGRDDGMTLLVPGPEVGTSVLEHPDKANRQSAKAASGEKSRTLPRRPRRRGLKSAPPLDQVCSMDVASKVAPQSCHLNADKLIPHVTNSAPMPAPRSFGWRIGTQQRLHRRARVVESHSESQHPRPTLLRRRAARVSA